MNRRLWREEFSGIRKFTNMAKEREDCLFLTIGEPDFNTPEVIKEAAKKALDNNMVHYAPWVGMQSLREKIVAFEEGKNSVCYEPEEVLVTDGATEGLYLALNGILNAGDEVIVPTPAFGLYRSIIELGGGVFVPLSTESNAFQLNKTSLKAVVTEKTKAIVLNSPNNPTGVIYNEESLRAVYDLIKKRNIFVICDDVYSQLVYAPGYQSFSKYQDIRQKIILVQSFSKSYAMTGWRAGYVLADRKVINELCKLHSQMVVSAVSFIQPACMAALDYDPKEMVDAYAKRKEFVYKGLVSMGMEMIEPKGAFYVFPSIKKYKMRSDEFCLRMLSEANLAVVPGSCFGADDHIRISYCYNEQCLKEGLHRIEGFLKKNVFSA